VSRSESPSVERASGRASSPRQAPGTTFNRIFT
jgi:hypothetical protein